MLTNVLGVVIYIQVFTPTGDVNRDSGTECANRSGNFLGCVFLIALRDNDRSRVGDDDTMLNVHRMMGA
jgi:hypothetical protein